jgi:hypothetical protein
MGWAATSGDRRLRALVVNDPRARVLAAAGGTVDTRSRGSTTANARNDGSRHGRYGTPPRGSAFPMTPSHGHEQLECQALRPQRAALSPSVRR